MYCLEKLQGELAYFFDMDLRELPRVQDLLAAKGYTQVQKGDEIIKLEPSAQAESTLSAKTTSKLTKDELDNLPIATAQEYGEFLEKIAQKDYQNTPEILKIATLNNDLQELINNNHSASVFITRARAGHISEARKGEYDQALTLEEQKQIPAEIAQAKQAYTDDKSGFILPFADKNNSKKINLIILDSDSKGNFLITAKKVNSAELDNPKYKKLARAGVEPTTTTPPKAEQKPTEAISLARDDIIPQTPQEIIKQAKASEKSVGETKELLQKAKELESKKDLNNELDFNGRTSQWQQEVIKQLELDKQASNKIVKIDNDSFIVYDGMSMYYYDKKSYDKALSNKDEYIKGVTEQQKSIAARSYKPYKDFSPPHFIDAIQPEKLIQYYHNMPEKQLQRLAESLRSGMNDNEFFTFIQNRSKEDVIYAQGHGFLSYLRKYFDLDFSDYPFTNLFLRKFFGKDKEAQQENFTKYVDKLYKDNGYPFGYVFNDSKTMQTLKDEDALSKVQGINAIRLLLNAKYGHIENAFHRKELGDIDLVWGEVQGSGEQAKGWGLAKIIEKHLNAGDFKAFGEGEQGLINAISEIIQDGKVVTQNGVDSIVLRKNGQEYRVGISKGWDNVGENKWIITSYKNNKYKESAETSYHDTFTSKEPLENPVSTIIPQTQMPKDAPTPPTQKGLFDEVDSSEAPPSKINFTYTTGEAKGIAELRKDLKQALEPYKSTPITNKETGLQGVVTDTERNKISSKKAVDKSIANGFTRDEHFAAAQDLKNLFENATKAQSHNDYKQRENIAQVHRFVKDLYINDKQAQAKITLFEKIEGKNRIYTLELESLENPTPLSSSHAKAGAAVEAQVTRDVVRPNANIAKTDEGSIAQDSNALLESTMKKFNYDERKAKDLLEWHKDSHPLTKDKNGVPKVFYHGTSADELFEVFSPRKDRTKWGFWFASGEDYADHYGKGKYGARQEPLKFSTFLKVKNPFDMTDDKNLEVLKKIMGKKEYEAAAKEVDFNHDNGASKIYRILSYSPFDRYKDKARAFQNKLKKLGYDGIKEQDGVMIVFEPNQIKHIENRGVAGRYFYSSSPNIFHSNPHAGAGLLGGSVSGVEQDENGNITFSPEKFALGLLGGTGASIATSKAVGKYAIMRRMEAKKHNKKLYNVFKAIDSSAKYGSKMNLIGKENLNAETLAYALARNKRFAINKLDEKVAKELGFKYPQDVRRSIDPNNVAHTLNRHGEQSNLVKFSGQKPVTLDEIAKYQDYADNATHKGISIGKRQETASISARQLDGEFYVVVEQIQKGRNELGFKTMYFERGILDDEKFNKLLKK